MRYLQESRVKCWPGVDGLTEDDVLECYPTACALGQVPGCRELCNRHPELAATIEALFAMNGWPVEITSQPCVPLTEGAAMFPNEHQPRHPEEREGVTRLSRWLVSYATETGWYSVGEFIALDAAAAIERAIEVFGPGLDYQAEEIPWDAAPLSRAVPPCNRNC
jgi:hypothetical protein